jgi:hypothetical protein
MQGSGRNACALQPLVKNSALAFLPANSRSFGFVETSLKQQISRRARFAGTAGE